LVAIVEGAIDVAALERSVRSEKNGGIVTFLGNVRNVANDGRAVSGLEYEAHREMALAECELIAREACERTGATLAIVHRVGSLAVGDTAVAICAAAPHRAEAFEACRYAIDEVKHRAQIWKKEFYLDGSADWVENAC
jgi:molybdopterin synthase catalytic subunit